METQTWQALGAEVQASIGVLGPSTPKHRPPGQSAFSAPDRRTKREGPYPSPGSRSDPGAKAKGWAGQREPG
eukprot:13870058-Alexandrium_andersonii.AAC.1